MNTYCLEFSPIVIEYVLQIVQVSKRRWAVTPASTVSMLNDTYSNEQVRKEDCVRISAGHLFFLRFIVNRFRRLKSSSYLPG